MILYKGYFSLNLCLDLNKYVIVIFKLNNVSLNPFRIIIDEIMLTKNDKLNFKYNTKVKAKENIINLFKVLVNSKHINVKIKSIIEISITTLLKKYMYILSKWSNCILNLQ